MVCFDLSRLAYEFLWRLEIEGPIYTLIAVAIYGVFHSLMARSEVKRALEDRLGAIAVRGYRLSYNLISVITLLPVLAIPALTPGDQLYQLSGPLLILTIAGQSIAILILIIGLFQTGALHFLGLRQALSQKSKTETELVIKGLYRWVRHPLYSAGLLFIWLSPVMTTSLLALNFGLTAYIFIGSIFEEHRLLREFGQTYEDYQKEVPRLIPRLKHLLKSR